MATNRRKPCVYAGYRPRKGLGRGPEGLGSDLTDPASPVSMRFAKRKGHGRGTEGHGTDAVAPTVGPDAGSTAAVSGPSPRSPGCTKGQKPPPAAKTPALGGHVPRRAFALTAHGHGGLESVRPTPGPRYGGTCVCVVSQRPCHRRPKKKRRYSIPAVRSRPIWLNQAISEAGWGHQRGRRWGANGAPIASLHRRFRPRARDSRRPASPIRPRCPGCPARDPRRGGY